jgi:hypothetical protein
VLCVKTNAGFEVVKFKNEFKFCGSYVIYHWINMSVQQELKKQVFRKDVLANLILCSSLSYTSKQIFEKVITDDYSQDDKSQSRQGWIYETLWIILITFRCIPRLQYTTIHSGPPSSLHVVSDVNDLFNILVNGGGNNIVDMTLQHGDTYTFLSIKYKEGYCETDVSKIALTLAAEKFQSYQIGLIVKDRKAIETHRYNNTKNIDKCTHDTIMSNGLLFDTQDLIDGLSIFRDRYSGQTVDDMIEFANTELGTTRCVLFEKLHQRMAYEKLIRSVLSGAKTFCLAHKPRSGKSITTLNMCLYLLQHGYKRILFMTSVPATIDSFVKELKKFIKYKNIQYKLQNEFHTIDEDFTGICFSSVQYLKSDKKTQKMEFMLKYQFDAIIVDESQQGSSTDRTKSSILEVCEEHGIANIPFKLFMSGTAEKTIRYYNIPACDVSRWDIQDEMCMKKLHIVTTSHYKFYDDELMNCMIERHGDLFAQCLQNPALDADYTNMPTQVLMKGSVPKQIIDKYNAKHGTSLGYSVSSLFALRQFKNAKGEIEYDCNFELCSSTDGEEFLVTFLETIISNDKNNNETVMKQIERTQTERNSRKSTRSNPLLFIVYLPTHTRNNTISKLQVALKNFLVKWDLWSDYNIEFSNSSYDSGDVKEEYNSFIETIMDRTKANKKRGCILLLGDKGGVGITYPPCDVTISLDDGHNLDKKKQRDRAH